MCKYVRCVDSVYIGWEKGGARYEIEGAARIGEREAIRVHRRVRTYMKTDIQDDGDD